MLVLRLRCDGIASESTQSQANPTTCTHSNQFVGPHVVKGRHVNADMQEHDANRLLVLIELANSRAG